MTTVTVTAPASKSLSHRAVICAALTMGRSTLSGVLESDDLERTIAIMNACGATIERTGEGEYSVNGLPGCPVGGTDEPVVLDVGESGTTCRLLTAFVAAGNGDFLITGRGRMHKRPVRPLTDVLEKLGVSIEWKGEPGCPPLLIRAAGLKGDVVDVDMSESSQYLSGMLLASIIARRQMTVGVTGDKVVSWPYVGLTLQAMEAFGAQFRVERLQEDGTWAEVPWREQIAIEPGKVRFHVVPSMILPQSHRVEGDWSNASYFLAAGALGPRPVRVENLLADSLQGDRAILELLARMGAKVGWDNDAVTVSAPEGGLKGIEADMSQCPDLVPTVAALAALADGPTRIFGAAHLRIKESDRIEAVATQLRRIGAQVEEHEDGMTVTPGPLITEPGVLSSFDDHRIAMGLSLFSLRGVRTEFDNPGCVAKSFPGFWEAWKQVV